MNNNLSFWILAQLVTPAQMNVFSQDIYQRFTAITEPSGILNLQGEITQNGTTITVPPGSFRFADLSATYTPFSSGIFGNIQSSTTITNVSGNGYIVARYSISPQIPNQYNYTIAVTCLFVTTTNSSTDVTLCTITNGLIAEAGSYLVSYGASQADVTAGISYLKAVTPLTLASSLLNYPTNEELADALETYAPLKSPAFTDNPTAPTAPLETNTTQLATTAFAYNLKGNFKTVRGINETSTLTVADMGEVIENVTTSGVTNLILPNVSTVPSGSAVGVSNTSTFAMTISSQVGQIINNGVQHAVTITIPSGGSCILYTDQSSWTVIAVGIANTFGVSQNWYDLTPERAWNEVYTNNTTFTIIVQVQGTSTTPSPLITPIVNGLELCAIGGSTGADQIINNITFVPPGQTYQMSAQNITLTKWVEFT